jgi:hypothetical protein
MSDELSWVDRFAALFVGMERAYGQWLIPANKARFVKKNLELKQYEQHIEGTVGLGVVPIREDNTCLWGAIDIDVDDIDHAELIKAVRRADLPLIVCRSKSGGAHCYTFISTPARASDLRKALAGHASILGYGQSEIFPKQDILGDGLGSWINLPYLGGNETQRYAVDDDGNPMSLEEFIEAAENLKVTHTVKQVKAEVRDAKAMPPCIRYFQVNGIPEGARNEVLFNFAVYLRKAYPDTWEQEFMKVNANLTSVPLPLREVQTLLKSISKKSYNYKCKVPLIANQCDRITCMTLDFGMRDNSNYSEFLVGGITKITTDPPFWLLNVNGVDVRMSTGQIYSYSQVRMRCVEVLGGMIPPMKDEEWRQLLHSRMVSELQIQEAPKDAGDTGRVLSALTDFVRLAARSSKKEDVAHGIPVIDQARIQDKETGEWDASDVVYFRSTDFISYLQRKKIIAFMPNNDLWAILREAGCGHTKIRAGKRIVQVWYLPVSREMAEEIRGAYAPPTLDPQEM